MSDVFEFNVEPRKTGKHFNRQARIQRKIPTVVYGPNFKNQNVFMEENAVKKYGSSSRYESTIFALKSEDNTLNKVQVLIKDVQFHPVTTLPVHVDLYALDMKSSVRVNAVVKYEGTPKGVKDDGGLLQIVLNEVEIECLPTNIPEEIIVDISGIELNGSMHVSDITLPADVKMMTSETRTLCTVSSPKEEAAAEPAEGEAEGGDAPAADESKSEG